MPPDPAELLRTARLSWERVIGEGLVLGWCEHREVEHLGGYACCRNCGDAFVYGGPWPSPKPIMQRRGGVDNVHLCP